MKDYICISTSDIHGNIRHYEKIKQVVVEQNASFVFLCGDLLPKEGGLWQPENKIRTIQTQKEFIQDYFLDYLKDLSRHAYVYAIFGNDDFKSNYPLVQKINDKVCFLENQVVRLPIPEEEIYVAGYPYVSLTPFLQKDWEKWDDIEGEIPHKFYTLEGYTSENDEHHPITFGKYGGHSTIAEDLTELARKSDPKKTVYMIHEPPYNTPLDTISRDNKFIKDNLLHIGSKAIRAFIETKQPLLSLHGHIHETFRESGEFQWKCGSSVSITASHDFQQVPLAYVLFDLPQTNTIERHIKF